MTERQKAVLALRAHGHTYKEIGEALGISAPAAYYVHQRALKRLRQNRANAKNQMERAA